MRRYLVVLALAVLGVAASVAFTAGGSHAAPRPKAKRAAGIHKIKHVIVIMQENRSFDHYFGTYPGANGFPRNTDGSFAVCNPDPATGSCVQPYHDESLVNVGGPHGVGAATADIDGGRMDGFVRQQRSGEG